MTSPAHDYLLKQLSVNGNIVTYRSLSRELGVHVNVAKNELATYHTSSASSIATYMITGEVPPIKRMDVDDGEDEYDFDEEDEEDMPEMKIVLVGEDKLASSKAQFTRIYSTFIYALSPAPIRDAGLICTPTPIVRQIDTSKYLDTGKSQGQGKGKGKDTDTNAVGNGAAKGVEWGKMVGKIIGAHVVMKVTTQPIASTSASTSKPTTSNTTSDTKPASKKDTADKDKDKEKPKPKAIEKPKATGKLDWSNAKTKDMKAADVKEVKEAKLKEKEKEKEREREGKKKRAEEAKKEKEREAKMKVDKEKELKPKEATKDERRGTKRKSTGALLSDSDSESDEAPPKSKTKAKPSPKPLLKPVEKPIAPSARVKKGVILSSDEEEEEAPKKRLQKGKGKRVERDMDDDDETEKSLRAMMDIDDDQVIRVSRPPPSTTHASDSEGSPAAVASPLPDEDGDVEMAADEDPPIKPQPRKRKPKKVIPVGRNGLKKRRVDKSRTNFDEKGYMVTEDYSSYESVTDNDEADEEPVKAKGKTKASKADETNSKKVVKTDPPGESGPSKDGTISKRQSSGLGKSGNSKSKMGGTSKGDIKNFFAKKS